ncbi:MAG: glycerol-3-phosphate acyltransferase, partial [Alphaproteobacteria bacterium]|nr:glycerol-3-phosphate acyltransferase [Alphaproteobacteria bacterium]
TWLVTAFLFRYSSLSALVALALSPLYAWGFGVWQGKNFVPYVICYGVLAVLSFIRHHANIARLLNGTETKIKMKRSK